MGCDLLSKLYLCVVKHSLCNLYLILFCVVICFQNCIFVLWNTAISKISRHRELLWFAFKIVSLCCETQPIILLMLRIWVVICFQNCIFVLWNTAQLFEYSEKEVLWFAFKIVSLCCETQLMCIASITPYSCDLLSKLYLCVVKHSKSIKWRLTTMLWFAFKIVSLCCETQQNTSQTTFWSVVICFQNCIFVLWNTAALGDGVSALSLWFAFKIVSLCCETQPLTKKRESFSCCDLLSKLYLCVVKHSFCCYSTARNMLWFAFKIVSLCCETQLN